ncbi:MAG: VWA domain-containing protein, partial [Clostridia bacterium]|nr:VWA domain-containing protein [Clostridia bacterium]
MAISFDQPLWWLALPGLVILVWYWRRPWLLQARAGSREAYRREWRRLLVRLLVLMLLVAALAGPRWFTIVNHQAVVFALDASASMGTAVAAGEAWLRQALALKPPRDRAGVIAFGETALVEVPLSEEPLFRRLETAPGTDGSNFGAALNLAQGLLPAEARRRLVLISDGRETGEEAVTLARELSQAGIRVDVYPLGAPTAADIRLDALELPPRAYAGESCSLQLTITASQPAAATVVLERDNELLVSREVNLFAGSNRLTLPVDVGPTGLHRYRARLLAEQYVDSISANNEAGAVQQVLGPPRVLLVADTAAEAAALQQVLEAGQVEVETVTPAGVPQDPAGWARYSAVFLLDVPAYSLGEEAMAQLESYVRDGGGGLMMSGGPDAFGPGGYAGTPIEKALPVEMQIGGQGELPSLSLMLVIDRSGSMDAYAGGANKIDLAKEAAARAAAMLTARDQVGVIAFDSSPWEVVPLGPVTNQELLRQQIGSIYAGGGTEIYPALAAAYHALAGATTRVT